MNAKLIVPLFAALLAACSSTAPQTPKAQGSAPQSQPQASAGTNSDQVCDSTPIADLSGRAWTDRLAQEAQQRSGASVMRVVKPGQVMTMEYNPRRLTVLLEEDNRVASARCG